MLANLFEQLCFSTSECLTLPVVVALLEKRRECEHTGKCSGKNPQNIHLYHKYHCSYTVVNLAVYTVPLNSSFRST